MSTEQQVQDLPNLAADDGFLDDAPIGIQQQENSGALYPNLSRKKESHPNCRGRSFIGGVWYWVSGWNNLQPNNTRYISLSYTPMTEEDVKKYITDRPTQAAAKSEAPVVPQGTPVEGKATAEEINKEAMAETAKTEEIF